MSVHDGKVRQLLVSALGKSDILHSVQILKLHHLTEGDQYCRDLQKVVRFTCSTAEETA